MPFSLSVRQCLPEWMDELGLDTTLHRQALRGLERINVLSRTLAQLWPPLADLAQRSAAAPVKVLDLACGAGDVAIGLAGKAQRQGIALEVHACDRSPTALDHGVGRATRHGVAVRFFRHDVLAEGLPEGFDAVICSLFLHHLERAQALRLLREMGRAPLAVVTDLDRGWSGFALAWLGTRLLTRSPVVHVDALRSVRAAWTLDEVRELASSAGLVSAVVTRHWPRRWRLVAARC